MRILALSCYRYETREGTATERTLFLYGVIVPLHKPHFKQVYIIETITIVSLSKI